MATAEKVLENESGPDPELESVSASRAPRVIRLGPQGGTYELVRPLAQGGMAEVFLARRVGSSGFRTEVAIKRLRRELLAGADVRAMFLHEAKLAAHLSHPNIARVFDLQEVGVHHFLVMEFVPGLTLRALIQKSERAKKPLSAGLVSTVGAAVAEALHYANTSCDENNKPLRIVHRDISPHNIVIGGSGEVKLIDFGIAWSQLEGRNETQGAKLKGKYAYMSPEQVGAESLDGRSDIFSLAVVMVEMLTGKRLFETKSESQTLLRVLEAAPTLVRAATEGIPAGLRGIITRCLARERDARYADGAELATALKTYVMSQQQIFGLLETAKEISELVQAAEGPLAVKDAGAGTDKGTPPSRGATPPKGRKPPSGPRPAVGTAPRAPKPPTLDENALDPMMPAQGADPFAETPEPDLGERVPRPGPVAFAQAITQESKPVAKPRGTRRLVRRNTIIGAAVAIAAVLAITIVNARSSKRAAAPAPHGSAPIAAVPAAAAPNVSTPAAASVAAAVAASHPAPATPAKAAPAPAPTPAPDEPRIPVPARLQARVFAGAPVKGAHVRVEGLLSDGSIDRSVGDNGVLASCASTSSDGRCDLELRRASIAGPLRVVASGPGARWTDPTDGLTALTLPPTAELSSTFAQMPGSGQRLPITLWTTLADANAQARLHVKPGVKDLRQSLKESDAIVAGYLGGGADFSVRSAIPEPLDTGSNVLTNGLRTALADAALGVWAHDLGGGSVAGRGFNAVALTQMLVEDVTADGRFDGVGNSGVALSAPGGHNDSIAATAMRQSLARALDEFVGETQPAALHPAALRMSNIMRNDSSLF